MIKIVGELRWQSTNVNKNPTFLPKSNGNRTWH
ncbi:MAG: hypothetical protein ACJAWV_003430 [Flammeovirgaceae bacterium]|jgi:hypothetical protein